MLDNQVTRYPGGVTNRFDNDIFANLKVPDPSIYHSLFEDFDQYTAAQWVTGGVNPVAPALVAGDGGILSMATTGASGDSNFIQQLVTAFTFVAGRPMFFRARAQVDDATLALVALGLQVAVAANNFLTPTDGVFFRKPAADTSIYLVSRVGGVETLSVALGTVVAGQQFECALAADGRGNIAASFSANTAPGVAGAAAQGPVRASITPAAITAVALRVTAGVQANSAAARTMLLDQLFNAKER